MNKKYFDLTKFDSKEFLNKPKLHINLIKLNEFGNNLKNLRTERGLSQSQVANAIKVGESTYANWEQGRREPSLYFLVILATYFDIDMNTLFDF